MPALSQRLSVIADFVPNNSLVADIGTDHGYLAIELIKNQKAKLVIASDIGEKPLKNAENNIKNANVEGIELRLADGLSGYKTGEIDTVIIAGMGGEVISGILSNGEKIAKDKKLTFILQPTTSPEFLRKYLYNNGYQILEETPIFENGKLYSVMLVRFTGDAKQKKEGFYYIGKVSIDNEAGKLYIEKQKRRCFECSAALKDIPQKRQEYKSFKSALDYIESVLNFKGE